MRRSWRRLKKRLGFKLKEDELIAETAEEMNIEDRGPQQDKVVEEDNKAIHHWYNHAFCQTRVRIGFVNLAGTEKRFLWCWRCKEILKWSN